jgi:hypothetical protein
MKIFLSLALAVNALCFALVLFHTTKPKDFVYRVTYIYPDSGIFTFTSKIMTERTPAECKKMGDKVKGLLSVGHTHVSFRDEYCGEGAI